MPTQIVTEYFRHIFKTIDGKTLDGIAKFQKYSRKEKQPKEKVRQTLIDNGWFLVSSEATIKFSRSLLARNNFISW